jgi:hypothetical protein
MASFAELKPVAEPALQFNPKSVLRTGHPGRIEPPDAGSPSSI